MIWAPDRRGHGFGGEGAWGRDRRARGLRPREGRRVRRRESDRRPRGRAHGLLDFPDGGAHEGSHAYQALVGGELGARFGVVGVELDEPLQLDVVHRDGRHRDIYWVADVEGDDGARLRMTAYSPCDGRPPVPWNVCAVPSVGPQP